MKEKIESQSCLTKQDESIRNAFVAFVLQDMPHKLNIATNGYEELFSTNIKQPSNKLSIIIRLFG